MRGRITVMALLLASLTLTGAAQASERNAVIVGAAVGALIGGSIAVQGYHGHVPVYVEIGAPPPRVYYYPAAPRYYYEPRPYYYEPRPYYRPYPVIVAPHYRYKHHHKHHYRKYSRDRGYYASPRW